MVKLDLQAAKNEFIKWANDSNWLLEYDIEACLNNELSEDDPDLESYNKKHVMKTINNIKKGRIEVLEDENGNVKINQILAKPVVCLDKEVIQFTYRNCNVGDLQRVVKQNKNEVDILLNSMSMLSGQTTTVINKMSILDYSVLLSVYMVFFT